MNIPVSNSAYLSESSLNYGILRTGNGLTLRHEFWHSLVIAVAMWNWHTLSSWSQEETGEWFDLEMNMPVVEYSLN